MKKKRLEEIKQIEREREREKKGSTEIKVQRRKTHQDMRMADQTETVLHSPQTIKSLSLTQQSGSYSSDNCDCFIRMHDVSGLRNSPLNAIKVLYLTYLTYEN